MSHKPRNSYARRLWRLGMASLLLPGCGYFEPGPPAGGLAFSARFESQTALRAASVPVTAVVMEVTIAGNDLPSPRQFKLSPAQPQHTERGLPLGPKNLRAVTRDANGAVLSSGQTTVVIEQGLNRPVPLRLITLPPDQAPTLLSIAITPGPLDLTLGNQVQLTATGTLVNKSTIATLPWTWAVSGNAVVLLNNAGAIRAVNTGQAVVTASFRNITGQTTIQVQAPSAPAPTPSPTPVSTPTPTATPSPTPTPTPPPTVDIIVFQE